MKALAATKYGPPEKISIVELPVPEPGPGQIQVRIQASTVNPTDIKAIAGGFREWVEFEFPYVPGNDFAGTVTALGPGSKRFEVGDEVFGQGLPRQLAFGADPEHPSLGTGAMAEYAVYNEDTRLIDKRPDSVPPEQAAALAIGGWTAIGLIDNAQIEEGETALVIGGLGGVGTALIPMLEKTGARVIATARTAEDEAKLRRLGARETIGFDPAGYPAEMDLAFNLALEEEDLSPAAAALRAGGRLHSIVFPEPSPEALGRDDVELFFFWDAAAEQVPMRKVGEAAAAGEVIATIRRTYAIEEGIAAFAAYARGGVRGNIVVTP